jgi:hypothetical protein
MQVPTSLYPLIADDATGHDTLVILMRIFGAVLVPILLSLLGFAIGIYVSLVCPLALGVWVQIVIMTYGLF